MKNLITTSIPYMNGVPHIGHAMEMILSDIIARYFRTKEEVYFLTGADEHGTKNLTTAKEKGMTVMDMLDSNVASFQKMNDAVLMSPDFYIRTTDQKLHWPVVQALWMRLFENDDIYLKKYAGYYCARHERFVTEKELDADKRLLEDGSPCVWTEDENYFFRLSKYQTQIRQAISEDVVRVLPDFRKEEVLAFIDQGLQDVSFSRSKEKLAWGIPVPHDDNHVMYVWCDALTNYISGCQFASPQEALDEWTCKLHVIGKDISRFHCVIWIGMLLSAKVHLPQNILVHGFINDKDGNKMSKSVGNVIDPMELLNVYGSTALRWYIAKETSQGQDMNFGIERMVTQYNDVLANGFGNLLNRTTTLIERLSPSIRELAYTCKPEIIGFLGELTDAYEKACKNFDMKTAADEAEKLIVFANQYMNQTTPWSMPDEVQRAGVLFDVATILRTICDLLLPYIPSEIALAKDMLGARSDTLVNIRKGDILFVKKEII